MNVVVVAVLNGVNGSGDSLSWMTTVRRSEMDEGLMDDFLKMESSGEPSHPIGQSHEQIGYNERVIAIVGAKEKELWIRDRLVRKEKGC